MAKALILIASTADRLRAIRWIERAPWNTRVEFRAPKRSIPQNSLLWAALTDVATQKLHAGRRYTADQWKFLFMAALGQEIQFLPSLDGKTFIPYGGRSSEMSRAEMMELLDFILAWGAQNEVIFSDQKKDAA